MNKTNSTMDINRNDDWRRNVYGENTTSVDRGWGWECPKCRRVYAPWVSMCQSCIPQPVTTSPTCVNPDDTGTPILPNPYRLICNGGTSNLVVYGPTDKFVMWHESQ